LSGCSFTKDGVIDNPRYDSRHNTFATLPSSFE